MTGNASVVIIGGGCIGIGISFYLARMGVKNIILLEREPLLGSCSTGLGAGGIRSQFSTGINIRLSLESLEIFSNFESETGTALEFSQVGYLFLASTEKLMKRFEKTVALQQSLGVASEILLPEEIAERYPFLKTSDLYGGSFCAHDGVADPHTVVQGYARAARSRGVEFREKTEVVGFDFEKGRVSGVRTSGGPVKTSRVIIASGAWSARVAAMGGVNVPITPLRRVCFITGVIPQLSQNIPFTIDSQNGFWMRGESGGVLMGVPNTEERVGFDISVDWELKTKVSEAAMNRAPVLSVAEIKNAWAGLYEMTPDNHPVIGAVPNRDGLFIAAGFSGHGFMHAPAVGKHVAELVVTGESSLDISMLSLSRFDDGNIIKEDICV